MIEWRNTLVLTLFSSLCFGVIIYGNRFEATGKKESILEKRDLGENSVSRLNVVNYYVLRKTGPYLHLNAKELRLDPNEGKRYFDTPKGELFTADKSKVTYEAVKGIFDDKSERLYLFESVLLQMSDSEIKSDELIYSKIKDEAYAKGSIKSYKMDLKTDDRIEITSDELFVKPSLKFSKYTGNVNGKILRKRAYEPPVFFGSNILTLETQQSLVNLIGDVWVKREGVHATSLKGEIFLENYNKKLKYYSLSDDVKVREIVNTRGGQTFKRESFSEKLEGIVGESKIVLTGYPKVYQERDILKGNKIVLFENSEMVEVDDANTTFKIKE